MPHTTQSLMDPELYAHGDPHTVWRAQHPVAWHQPAGHDGFWSVTGYRSGQQVLHDWQLFTSTQGILLRPDLSAPYPGAGMMLALTDPPRHDVLRKAVWGLFAPRAIARLESRAEAIIKPLVSRALDAGGCDFVTDIAAKIPLALSAELLGVSIEDQELINAATASAATNSQDIHGVDGQQAHYELLMYYWDTVEKRRSNPGDDVPSALLNAQRSGADITDEEIVLTCDNIIVAAGETTKNTAGSGLLALLEHPEEWQALRDGRRSMSNAVEEILRWAPPVTHVMRTATVDTTLDDREIRAGDAVAVWMPSVNRDSAAFGDGDTFRLDRHPNRHLSFGGGVHFCLGAPLARLVLRVLITELMAQTSEVTLAANSQRLASFTLWGLSSLPIELRRAGA